MRTKVEMTFVANVRSSESITELGLAVKPMAKVCYGENLNEKRMSEFLDSRIKGTKGFGDWAQATRELEDRLIARGGKE